MSRWHIIATMASGRMRPASCANPPAHFGDWVIHHRILGMPVKYMGVGATAKDSGDRRNGGRHMDQQPSARVLTLHNHVPTGRTLLLKDRSPPVDPPGRGVQLIKHRSLTFYATV